MPILNDTFSTVGSPDSITDPLFTFVIVVTPTNVTLVAPTAETRLKVSTLSPGIVYLTIVFVVIPLKPLKEVNVADESSTLVIVISSLELYPGAISVSKTTSP